MVPGEENPPETDPLAAQRINFQDLITFVSQPGRLGWVHLHLLAISMPSVNAVRARNHEWRKDA